MRSADRVQPGRITIAGTVQLALLMATILLLGSALVSAIALVGLDQGWLK